VDEAVQQFVERMGLICEKEGMARSSGRIFGLLLVGGRPYALDELAEKLQASKAGVSTNCRMLEQFGMIERVSALGDRRDFYQVRSDPWEHMMRVAQGRWRDMNKIFAEALAAIPAQMGEGRRRLREAEQFHSILIREVDTLLEHWRAIRGDEVPNTEHAA
jgi:DNA-binding transcriptional regulator GbsR (MarR family)